jgi:glycosyltransferase involved in cell wall biosynthesis
MFVINTLARGGAERQLVALATGLDRARFTPSVACVVDSGPLADELTAAGIAVSAFDVRRPRELLSFIRHTRKLSPDIVHSFLFGSNIVGTIAATIGGVPVVITSRRSLGFFKDGRPHYDALQWLANRFTDAVVANANAIRDDTARREHLDPQRISVIHNGVDFERFSASVDRSAVRQGLRGRGEDAGPLVVVVANLIPYKGHKFFIDAWRDVLRRMPTAWAIVVGEGPARTALEAWSADIAGHLSFVGSRDDVPAILASADLVVQASLSEGSPNAVLEAMAAARPVVATSVGGTVEAVVHEKTGLLVMPRDTEALAAAMLRLLGDPELARVYGRAGCQRVHAKFSMSQMVSRYAELYMSLTAHM